MRFSFHSPLIFLCLLFFGYDCSFGCVVACFFSWLYFSQSSAPQIIPIETLFSLLHVSLIITVDVLRGVTNNEILQATTQGEKEDSLQE